MTSIPVPLAGSRPAGLGPVVRSSTARLRRRLLPVVERSRTQPWGWLSGLVLNLALSLLYLVVSPLSTQPHRDWAILVGSYFAVFILGDVTTTNTLGADAHRVRHRLRAGTSIRRILLAKNLVLLLVVGVPTLVATAVLTLYSESGYHLAVTIPGVLLPILGWLGVGNLISVALPVASVPWRQRWEQRRDLRSTGRWLLALTIPYVLCAAVDPLTELPMRAVHALLGLGVRSIAIPAVVLTGTGLTVYLSATAGALVLARRRTLRFSGRSTRPEDLGLAGPVQRSALPAPHASSDQNGTRAIPSRSTGPTAVGTNSRAA